MPRLTADRKHTVTFTLNGRSVSGMAEPRMLLTDFLRLMEPLADRIGQARWGI